MEETLVSHDLVLEVTPCHFCCILFMCGGFKVYTQIFDSLPFKRLSLLLLLPPPPWSTVLSHYFHVLEAHGVQGFGSCWQGQVGMPRCFWTQSWHASSLIWLFLRCSELDPWMQQGENVKAAEKSKLLSETPLKLLMWKGHPSVIRAWAAAQAVLAFRWGHGAQWKTLRGKRGEIARVG